MLSVKCRKACMIIGLIWLTSTSSGEIIFEYTGDTNPVSEGWTLNLDPPSSVGLVTNDLGLGIDAWFVDDTRLSHKNFTRLRKR